MPFVKVLSDIDRFMSHVDVQPNGCWKWKLYLNQKGYGSFHFGKKIVRAHRWSYEYFIGPVPDGLTLDHLCKNKSCVNPDHLEPCTTKENTLRSDGLTARQARQTTCWRGHPFDEKNTRIEIDGSRRCRKCKVIQQRGRRLRRKLGL